MLLEANSISNLRSSYDFGAFPLLNCLSRVAFSSMRELSVFFKLSMFGFLSGLFPLPRD